MNICTNSAGLIVMVSQDGSPTPPAGGAAFALTPAQVTAYAALAASPNGGITFINSAFAALPFVPFPPFDYSNIDNLDKTIRAIGLMVANFTGKTPAQVKAAFLAAYQSLP